MASATHHLGHMDERLQLLLVQLASEGNEATEVYRLFLSALLAARSGHGTPERFIRGDVQGVADSEECRNAGNIFPRSRRL